MIDEERIGLKDKVLVIITNQYMFEQLLWYRSKYPEGIWHAMIIKFGSEDLMETMYQKCLDCGFFSKIVKYDYVMHEKSFIIKVSRMFQYFFQFVMHCREKCDRKLITSIMGDCGYAKVIVQSAYSILPTAAINAMSDNILVCLEDGFADYLPIKAKRHWYELLNVMLAKMNIMKTPKYGHSYRLKYDNRWIKYNSLPDKMHYKDYKMVKQLFENDTRKKNYSEKESSLVNEGYDMVIFSTVFSDYGRYEKIYFDTLYSWIKIYHPEKKILFKLHPRERFSYSWDGLDVHIGGEEVEGERLLDLMPDAEIVFTYTTTILLKACREKRDFKILCFNNIKSPWYHLALKNDSQVLGLGDSNWIFLGDGDYE